MNLLSILTRYFDNKQKKRQLAFIFLGERHFKQKLIELTIGGQTFTATTKVDTKQENHLKGPL